MSSVRLLTQVVSPVFPLVVRVALIALVVLSLEVPAVHDPSPPQLPAEVSFPHFADPAAH